MPVFYSVLSLLPIVLLLLVSLLKGVKAGIYSGFAVTIALFFIWDSQLIAFPAALIAAFINTMTILMIVFGALLLHQNMEQVGFITQIKNSLTTTHTDKKFQFYFLAFFLTAFFESVSGFGTPGAIVPLLLISLGFSPITSIVVVLLIDGLFAITGAVGTPVIAGFEGTLDLSDDQIRKIYFYASCFMIVSGSIILFFIENILKKQGYKKGTHGWKLFFCIAIPYVCLSYFLKELTGVVASAIMGVFAYFFLFTNRKLAWKPWFPYVILIVLLLLPKIIPPLKSIVSFSLPFNNILESSVSTSFQPFRSPLFPFIIAAICAALLGKSSKTNLKPVFNKIATIFIILFPSLAITQLMLSSGSEMPSMVSSMSSLFTKTGAAYPILSPFIGVVGTFITGSTTVSNIIFGSVQYNAAENLSLSKEIILAMQLNGGSLGNAICLFNIIAAAAVAGVSKYVSILQKTILPIVIATLATSILGMILLAVL
ncbi:MAG: L-lactate permease [Algibacter sp.]|uniref:L-lactate permease n=1 Tax=Algibacter sp. TaxID=1872428 RepID=UPI003298A842